MNKRLFSIVLLISALPLFVMADGTSVTLNSGDFVSAERTTPVGDTLLKLKLSKSGKAKLRKISKSSGDGEVNVALGDLRSQLKLKGVILDEDIQIGPYNSTEATQVMADVNKK